MKIDFTPAQMQEYAAAAGHAFVQTLDAKYLAMQTFWLNQVTLSKYEKELPELKLLVIVKSGEVTDIKSTHKIINITLLDLDNYTQGYANEELAENNFQITKVKPGYIEERIVEINKEYPVLDNEEEN